MKTSKIPNQETGFGYWGLQEALKDTKLILKDQGATHAHFGQIWYLSEPSDDPYSPKQFLGCDFFWRFLQQTGSSLACPFHEGIQRGQK